MGMPHCLQREKLYIPSHHITSHRVEYDTVVMLENTMFILATKMNVVSVLQLFVIKFCGPISTKSFHAMDIKNTDKKYIIIANCLFIILFIFLSTVQCQV